MKCSSHPPKHTQTKNGGEVFMKSSLSVTWSLVATALTDLLNRCGPKDSWSYYFTRILFCSIT